MEACLHQPDWTTVLSGKDPSRSQSLLLMAHIPRWSGQMHGRKIKNTLGKFPIFHLCTTSAMLVSPMNLVSLGLVHGLWMFVEVFFHPYLCNRLSPWAPQWEFCFTPSIGLIISSNNCFLPDLDVNSERIAQDRKGIRKAIPLFVLECQLFWLAMPLFLWSRSFAVLSMIYHISLGTHSVLPRHVKTHPRNTATCTWVWDTTHKCKATGAENDG